LTNTLEVFRFLTTTPNAGTDYNPLTITVRAWGGQTSFDKPYGDEFMGEIVFDREIIHESWDWDGAGGYGLPGLVTNDAFSFSRAAWYNYNGVTEDNILTFNYNSVWQDGTAGVTDLRNALVEIYLETVNVPVTVTSYNLLFPGTPYASTETRTRTTTIDSTWGDFCIVKPVYLVTDYFEV
jgi:hypothetical protein